MISKYTHVIWDWNGTILNDVDLCVDVGNNLFRKKGIPLLTVEKYKEIFTIPVRDYYVAAGFDFENESFEVVGKEWMDEYEERKYECSLHFELVNVMNKIKDSGVGQSVLSAYKQDNLTEMIKTFNLDPFLDHIVGLDNIYAAGKVHLAKDLITKLGNGKAKVLMIGDTIHDFEVAKEVGADCVLISAGHQTFDKLKETKAEVFNSLSEFKQNYFEN